MLKYNLTWALLLWWGAMDRGHHPDWVAQCARDVLDEHNAACALTKLPTILGDIYATN